MTKRLRLLSMAAAWVGAQALGAGIALAQASPEPRPPSAEVAESLVGLGLENVAVETTPGGVLVYFENRRYREPAAAVAAAVRAAAGVLPPGTPLVITPLRYGQALYSLRIPVPPSARGTNRAPGSARAERDVEIVTAIGLSPPSPGRLANKTRWRADVILEPVADVELGSYADPFETRLGIASTLETQLARGLLFRGTARWIVQDELTAQRWPLRPGPITLSYRTRLIDLDGSSAWVRVAAGYFTADRYGADAVAAALTLSGRLLTRIRVGQTGFASFADGAWTYGPARTTTYQLAGSVLASRRHNLALGAGWGRFLLGDTGWKIEARRPFRFLDVCLVAMLTSAGEQATVRLTLPLPLRRHPRPGPVRLRAADRQPWTYHYDNLSLAGIEYGTGLGAVIPFANTEAPPHVSQQLHRYLWGNN